MTRDGMFANQPAQAADLVKTNLIMAAWQNGRITSKVTIDDDTKE